MPLGYLYIRLSDATTNYPSVIRLRGLQPFILTRIDEVSEFENYWRYGEYMSSSHPIPMGAHFSARVYNEYLSCGNNDLMMAYDFEPFDRKNFDNLMVYYKSFVEQQALRLIEQMKFSKTVEDKEAQFIQGIRLVRYSPVLALQIMADAYDWDKWADTINWGDPRTYYGAIKEALSWLPFFGKK